MATSRDERSSHKAITGLLDPHMASWIEQYAHCDIKRLLRSGDDHDLARIAFNSASSSEISANRLSELLRTARINMVKRICVWVSTMEADQIGPNLKWELVKGRLMYTEGTPTAKRRRTFEGRI
jgi:hypothetical protein